MKRLFQIIHLDPLNELVYACNLIVLFTSQGTPDRLMRHLVDPHCHDPTYVEDFLLTYRTFLKSPLDLVKNLMTWFEDDSLKTNVSSCRFC